MTLNFEHKYAICQGGRIRQANRALRLEFGKRFREVLAGAGYQGYGAASAVGRAIGAAPSLVAAWLRGDQMPSGRYPAKLLELLGPAAQRLWAEGGTGGVVEGAPHSGSLRAAHGRSPMTLATVAPMIARAVGRAVERTLAMDELHQTTKGREFLAEWLLQVAQDFTKFGADVSDLIATAEKLRKGVLK